MKSMQIVEVLNLMKVIEMTPEKLQKRVMEQAEWKILPEAVRLFCDDKITVKDGKTYICDSCIYLCSDFIDEHPSNAPSLISVTVFGSLRFTTSSPFIYNL